MNYPAGVTQRDISNLCSCVPRTEICENCDREFEYNRDNGKWYYVDGPLGPIVPENTQHGWFCCQDCLEEGAA